MQRFVALKHRRVRRKPRCNELPRSRFDAMRWSYLRPNRRWLGQSLSHPVLQMLAWWPMRYGARYLLIHIRLLYGILLPPLLYWILHAHQQKVEKAPLHLVCDHLSLRRHGIPVFLAFDLKLLVDQKYVRSFPAGYLRRVEGLVLKWCTWKQLWTSRSLDLIGHKYDRVFGPLADRAQPILRPRQKSKVLLGLSDHSNNFDFSRTYLHWQLPEHWS